MVINFSCSINFHRVFKVSRKKENLFSALISHFLAAMFISVLIFFFRRFSSSPQRSICDGGKILSVDVQISSGVNFFSRVPMIDKLTKLILQFSAEISRFDVLSKHIYRISEYCKQRTIKTQN